MNSYILIYETENCEKGYFWRVEEARSVIEFLMDIDDHILISYEWEVYEIEKSIHKDEFVHDGTIDEITDGEY